MGKTKIVIGILIFFFVIFILGLIGSSSTKQESSKTVAPSPSGSPSSQEDCSKYAGTAMFATCNQLNYAAEMGDALSHSLTGTVQYGYAQLTITNNGNVAWNQCDAVLGIGGIADVDPSNPNSYWSDGFAIPAHQTITIGWGNFTQQDGTRFDYSQKKPSSVDITCDDVAKVKSRSIFTLQ